LIDHVIEGRDATVREVLITLGGTSEGELPDPDEVLVMRKLGRTTLVLPLGVECPSTPGRSPLSRRPKGTADQVVGKLRPARSASPTNLP
jgi:hypothetical protein